MKFLKKIKESRLNLILLLLYPIVTFYLLEWFTHNPENHEGNSAVLNIVCLSWLPCCFSPCSAGCMRR
ncbi:MAG: hypothetical protein ACLVAW_24340 [Eisenbergiella massiliensis]